MKTTEGITWEKDIEGKWSRVLDAWPSDRRGARILVNNTDLFGNYGKNEAIKLIEEWITRPTLPEKYFRFSVVPGKEMAPEDKKKLQEYNAKKKAERGETPEQEPVESYISSEDQ